MLWCTRPTLSEWLYIDYLIALLPNQPGKLKDPSKGIYSLDNNMYILTTHKTDGNIGNHRLVTFCQATDQFRPISDVWKKLFAIMNICKIS